MDKIGCEMTCKSHSARSERDHYRINPTKLSKTELEDVYFALLEDHLQLKKTINVQQDRIKVLSTKVQRMTSTQNVLRAEENKYCCVATKAVVSEQKEIIAELTRANERMAERVRKLNMRVCSAKQFCKSATPRVLRCSNATSPYLIKQSTCSYKQQSQSTLKLAVSCQNFSRETLITKCIQTEPIDSTQFDDENEACEDNKCKTIIDEFKEKIIELQEKLLETQQEYDSELQRCRGERVASEHELQRAEKKNSLLTSSLRTAEGLNCELKMQLSIEKRRVLELETRLKAATMSNKVTKNIDDTLNSMQESNRTGAEIYLTCTCCYAASKLESSSQQTYMSFSRNDGINIDTKLSKNTEDSGYMDINNSQMVLDDQSMNKIIEELTKRIMVLQTQVDALTISPPEADEIKTKVDLFPTEDLNLNTQIVIEHSTPKDNLKHKKTFSENPEKAHLTEAETDEASTNNPGLDEDNVTRPVSSPESSQSEHWERSKTKIQLITKRTKENKSTGETADSTKNKEDINENLEKDMDNKNKKANVRANKRSNETSHYDESLENEEKQMRAVSSSSTEDKPHNIKSGPETEKQGFNKGDNLVDNYTKYSQERIDDKGNIDSPRKLSKYESKNEEIEHKNNMKLLMNPKKEPQVDKHQALARTTTLSQNVSTCDEATYTVESDSSRSSSPDNTDCEISSMTDLTEEREPNSPTNCYLSPGERKYLITRSDSYTMPSTNYSLSEGEVHVTPVRRRSYDAEPRAASEMIATAPKMEETLQAITEELARCKRLLSSHRSQDNVTSEFL